MADSIPDEHVHNTPHENVEAAAAAGQEDSPSQERPRRFSQYAEANANPLPQIVVEPVTEPVGNMEQLDCDDTASTHPVVEPDDPFDRRSSAVVYAGEEPSRFRKYRTPMIVGLVIAVIILTGTVVGVLVSRGNHSGGSSGGEHSTTSSAQAASSTSTTTSSASSSPSSSPSSSLSISSTIASSTTTAAGPPVGPSATFSPSSSPTLSSTQPSSVVPTQSSTPSECADTSKYLTKVSFMSIVDGSGYNVRYYATDDATACCTYCYTQVKEGCDSWAWTGGFIGTACGMITGWKGSDSDATCPQGHTTVSFQQTASNESQVGGVGPCAALAS